MTQWIKDRWVEMFVRGVMFFSFFTISVITYLTFFDFREPPLRIRYSHPVALLTLELDVDKFIEATAGVKPGQIFFTHRSYCIVTHYHVLRNERWLVRADGKGLDVPMPLLPLRARRDIGCTVASLQNEVPLGTPPGEYIFRSTWDYVLPLNPIATFHWQWPDIRVKVIE
jgi:hypothetical protein